MGREKWLLDPLAVVGLALALMASTASVTAYVVSKLENTAVIVNEAQLKFLRDQLEVEKLDSQQKSDVLQRIYEKTKNTELERLIEPLLEKESTEIIESRNLGINEALNIPETRVRIIYENLYKYPTLQRIIANIPFRIIRKSFVYPSSLLVMAEDSALISNFFPRAGLEAKFKYKDIFYRLVVLAVKEDHLRISVFREERPVPS